jgi:hypothetical protein
MPGVPGARRAAAALAVLVVSFAVTAADRPVDTDTCGSLPSRAVSDLEQFSSWTREHRVPGVVGEVGWPAGWGPVARRWSGAAVRDGLGVYVWGAAEQWDPAYPLAAYRSSPTGDLLAGPQAELVESGLPPARDGIAALRGVALSGPSFGAELLAPSSYSTTRPGARDRDYRYPSWRFLVRLAERGVRSVRLAVQWERLQAAPYAELDRGELDEVQRVLDAARELGMSVVLDLHNYGRYAVGDRSGARRILLVGSEALPASALGDLWQRLARELGDSPALAAYGLMNEPFDLPGGAARWEATTREVVASIRRVDATRLVLVPGYGWSAAATWREHHPAPWIDDAAVAYEAHQYFDADRSGRYRRPLRDEAADAARRCFSRP